ncbi:hypothetical protein R1sor_012183 [Riccia sorocarpa]|uniref:Uncharacterized protein n=1 Tax=Riccia sorocarpa TaxID=122646 RepID=A0ABD3I5R8_9MARC
MAEEPIATQTASQTTPRRRGKDPGEGLLGPDDLVTIGNVHRLVAHEMIYTVFSGNVQCHGTPARGLSFEFSLGFVKLLYARAVLGRRVDFSKASSPDVRADAAPDIPLSQTTQTQIPQTLRKNAAGQPVRKS